MELVRGVLLGLVISSVQAGCLDCLGLEHRQGQLFKFEEQELPSLEIKNHPIFDPAVAECYLKNKGIESFSKICASLVNDPGFIWQWYLMPRPMFKNGVTVDLGIIDVWIRYKFFGENVVVVVHDDGVETNHPDLKQNYNPQFGWDFCDDQDTPNPNPTGIAMYKEDDHGTMVAGVLVMGMNNNLCGVGVAPLATLGAARTLCRSYTSALMGRMNGIKTYIDAITKDMEKVHITVHSYSTPRKIKSDWSPSMSKDFLRALEETSLKGRNGKGTIHVYSAGNTKSDGFTCAFHTFANNIYTILVSSTDPWGRPTTFSSRCAAIMITAPTSHDYYEDFYTIRNYGKCTNNFGGTSASAPLVGGILALLFNANPNLSGRDVQHLLAHTSLKDQIEDPSSWIQNGAGFHVSHDYGFGMINAKYLVEDALKFKSVPSLHTCTVIVPLKESENSFTFPNIFHRNLHTSACQRQHNEVNFLEHVQLTVSMSYSDWRHLQIDLISPLNTEAHILEREPNNDFTGAIFWTFDSIITWGESPNGNWTIKIYDKTSPDEKKGVNIGFIYLIELKFFGTRRKPYH